MPVVCNFVKEFNLTNSSKLPEEGSFSGERQTLATTRVKGHVSVRGKLTTRWGALKLR